MAASALGMLRDRAAGPVLIRALEDPVPTVRQAAFGTLRQLDRAPAAPKE